MQGAYAKLRERAGGRQDLNEMSPVLGETPACASGRGADSETL